MTRHLRSTIPCFFSVTMIIVIAFLSSGCRDRAPVTTLEKVTICVGGASGIPAILAKVQGIFQQNGLDVTLKRYITGAQAFDGMFAGECNLAACGETLIVLKSFSRNDFSILATLATSEDSTRIAANRKSGISGPRDLKGKRVFVLRNSINHFFLEMFLIKNGLTLNDIQMVSLEVKDAAAALQKGTIDAFASTDVVLANAIKALGNDAVVLSAPGLCLNTFNLTAMNSFITEQPSLIRKVLSALIKTEEIMKKEPQQTTTSLSSAMNIDTQAMADILGNYQWNVSLSQTLFLSLEHEARWAIRNRLTTRTTVPNYLDYIHTEALRSGTPAAVSIIQ